MDPHRPISNSIVKGYSGEDTERGAFWENNTMSKFLTVNYSVNKFLMQRIIIIHFIKINL